MTSIDSICSILAQIAPLRLAESWDNVGLLVGDRTRAVARVMTCLTITPNVVDEAVSENADLIVTHHPLPFKALGRITNDSIAGAMLLRLIANSTAIYSAHTAYDSAAGGINQMWAEALGLESAEPLVEQERGSEQDAGVDTDCNGLGGGRMGRLSQPLSLDALVRRAAEVVGATLPRRVGPADQIVNKVALACGSGGSFLSAARRRGCDAMITGEATFHTCLEAESCGIGLGMLGHYWSERFAMERLADQLSSELDDLTIWPSRHERDPIEPVTR